ncbi:PTS system mannose/fructose/sorbose family transporter subunit IID [Jeotgalibaca sp. MA1X17-3]|uniref:PTS system mannose/fructose/sorbose family transporter subunit IID n=1 Tax=Jeotgalibaca sp. MA1X17-3 TaxID=2908211 RepID=UPI001F301826|nr:PTS system mannose/fructose/sorbose family transporter subunit IID [Jeotgalibaca sp. MA1X17-3]UJF15896.1 PTS system mannose/fructose/sorbose family transporter subunit IID [Jeotgalibaca sp. MA1X17-3]
MESDKSKVPQLTKKDYLITSLRSYFLQSSFNYTTYQGHSYAYTIFPALKKIYAGKPDELKMVLKENIEFYNTNPQTVPFITNLQLSMIDQGESLEDARSAKLALMGPLSGIGDSVAQFGLAPLLSALFAGMALEGITSAPILFLLFLVGSLMAFKVGIGSLGYRLGTSVIETLSEQINKISRAATIVGMTVISGLAVNVIKTNITLQFSTTLDTGEQQVIAFQTILDQILPKMLPALLVIGVYYLIKKYNWTTYKIIGLLIVLGMVGSILGILG